MRDKATRRRLGAAAAAGICALAVAACGSSSNSGTSGGSTSGGGGKGGGTVTLGVIADQTGPTAATQVPFLHGIQTAVNASNKAGGANGWTIKLDPCDEKYNVQNGLACYTKLVKQDKVAGLVGSLNDSDVQQALIAKLSADKIPVLGAESTNQSAIDPLNPWFFAMECAYTDQADVATGFMNKQTGTTAPKVAAMTLSVSSGIEWSKLIKARVEKAGGKMVGAYPIPPTSTNADAVVQKIAAAKPDWITVHGGPNISEILLKSMQKFGVKIPVVGIFATGGHLPFQSVSPTYAKLFYYVNCYTPADVGGPGVQKMLTDAKASGFGKEAQTNDPFTNGYVVGLATVAAVKNLPSGSKVDGTAVMNAIQKVQNLDTQDLSPPVTFGPKLRVGVIGLRPYTWDAATKKIKAVGSYSDYNSQLTGEWMPAESKYALPK
jgi:ABC-type branched-subunit amino acid transport system substrate-binding protein